MDDRRSPALPIVKEAIPESVRGFALRVKDGGTVTQREFRHFILPDIPTSLPPVPQHYVDILPRPPGINPSSSHISDTCGVASESVKLAKKVRTAFGSIGQPRSIERKKTSADVNAEDC